MNPVRDGIILAVYELIIIITYAVVSGPAVTLIVAIGNTAPTVPQMVTAVSNAQIVLMMCFAIAGLIPVIWFMFRVFAREPDWGYRYY